MRRPRPLIDPLATIPLFAPCSRKERARLARQVEVVRVTAGTTIAQEGRPSRAMWAITSGEVALTQHGRPVAQLVTGDHLGEVSALSGKPMAVTATAATDVELVEIGQRELVALVDHVPALTRRLLRDLASTDQVLDAAA